MVIIVIQDNLAENLNYDWPIKPRDAPKAYTKCTQLTRATLKSALTASTLPFVTTAGMMNLPSWLAMLWDMPILSIVRL